MLEFTLFFYFFIDCMFSSFLSLSRISSSLQEYKEKDLYELYTLYNFFLRYIHSRSYDPDFIFHVFFINPQPDFALPLHFNDLVLYYLNTMSDYVETMVDILKNDPRCINNFVIDPTDNLLKLKNMPDFRFPSQYLFLIFNDLFNLILFEQQLNKVSLEDSTKMNTIVLNPFLLVDSSAMKLEEMLEYIEFDESTCAYYLSCVEISYVTE